MGYKNSATAQFFGLLFNWALYGTLTTQVYTYHISFQQDRIVYKTIVYGVFLLENAQTAAMTYGVYDSLITHFGDPNAVEKVQLTWFGIPVCAGIISFVAHMVYVYRVYMLSRSFLMTGLVLLFAQLQLATSLVEAVHAHNSQTFNKFEYTSRVILATWSFSTAACDVIIAASMTYCLIKCDPRHKKTTAIVTRLIRLGIETGTATAIIAILNAVFFISLPGNENFNIPAFILSKSYSNALLRLLNSRLAMSQDSEHENTVSAVQFAGSMSGVDPYSWSERNSWNIRDLDPTFQPPLPLRKNICIRRETVVFRDSDPKGDRRSLFPPRTTSSE